MPPPFPSATAAIEDMAAAARRERPISALEAEVAGLFDETRTPLLRYLLSLGLPVQDGEEIVQETFLSLFRHLQQDKSQANLRGWLFRVAHNLGLKRRTRNQQQKPVPGSAEDHACLVDPAQSIEQELITRQCRQSLEAVLHSLPEQDQHCLYLRAEGLRYREIAAVLDISLGGVALSLQRSLKKLQRVPGTESL